MHASYSTPPGLLAGFYAGMPDAGVPEIRHVGEQWAPRRFAIPVHTHPVWEFYLQISGETFWEGPTAAAYRLTPGAFLAVPPHVPHRLQDQIKDKHHFFFAALDISAALDRLPVATAWQRDTILFVPNGETLLAPFRQLVREVSLTLPYRSVGLRLAFDALVLEATRLIDSSAAGGKSLTLRHPAVRRAKELIDHKPALAWRLADLAQLSGMSAHHLVECFTREIGVSPRRYLLCVRIDRAKELLLGSDLSITDLALELGFSSPQHFAATFKRITGETAQSYRSTNASLSDTS